MIISINDLIVTCQQSINNDYDLDHQINHQFNEYDIFTSNLINIQKKSSNLTLFNIKDSIPISAISLAIVFDSTGSMGNDLKQVKIGSRRILQRHLQRGESNYIKDFVLVKVHDPGKLDNVYYKLLIIIDFKYLGTAKGRERER
ncbi:unnamed protein product [Schistosoma margrebowiei]|uniref:Hemicentin-1-like von Willebrand factor A domain-containing protein n=1 Tax=Schistosoma margrebowiei TaxID=48269 RepID=A0A183M1F5_9TREM|nr:unnamed protein product [Schistosoma margrebowiei]